MWKRTRKRTSALVLGGVATVGLLLTACTPQVDSGDTDAGAPDEAGDRSSVEIAFVAPGPYPAFHVWLDGAEAAVADFGLGGFTFDETGEFDQTKQNAAIDALAAQGYTTFAIGGNSPSDINTTFASLKEQGFAVAGVTICPLEDNQADFCYALDIGEASYINTQFAIEQMGGEGNLVHLAGLTSDTNTLNAIDGVERAVAETNGAVTLIQTLDNLDTDLQTAQKAVDDLLASRGSEIDAIISSSAMSAIAASQGVPESGLDILVFGFNEDPVIVDAIRDGKITSTIAEDLGGQAYVAAGALALLATGECTMREPGAISNSGHLMITSENVDTWEEELRSKHEQMFEDFKNDYMDC